LKPNPENKWIGLQHQLPELSKLHSASNSSVRILE
jgi:hypothetical protein